MWVAFRWTLGIVTGILAIPLGVLLWLAYPQMVITGLIAGLGASIAVVLRGTHLQAGKHR